MFLVKRHFKREDYKNIPLQRLLGLIKHVLYKRNGWGYRKGQTKTSERIEPYKHKIITLYSFKQIDEFLESL